MDLLSILGPLASAALALGILARWVHLAREQPEAPAPAPEPQPELPWWRSA